MKNYHKEYAQLIHSLCIVSFDRRFHRSQLIHSGCSPTESVLRNHPVGHRRLVRTLHPGCSTKLHHHSSTERVSLHHAERDRRFSLVDHYRHRSAALPTTTRSARCSEGIAHFVSFNESIRSDRLRCSTSISTRFDVSVIFQPVLYCTA